MFARETQVRIFFFLYALICILTVLIFLSPASGKETAPRDMTLYDHDYRIRILPRELHTKEDAVPPPIAVAGAGTDSLFTPRFTQGLYEDMEVPAAERDAYAGLHTAYMEAAARYIQATSLPAEYHEPFVAFMAATKAVEQSGNATPKNVIPLLMSASDYAASPDILMQFSSGNLMGFPPDAYVPEDRDGCSGPLAINHMFLSYPILPDELGVICSPSGTRRDRDRPALTGDRWNLYDTFNCIAGSLQTDLGGKFGRIPEMYNENFYTRFGMFASWHNAGSSGVYAHSDKELCTEIAHILGSDGMIAYMRELIMEQVNAGNRAKMRGFLYGSGGNEDLIAKPVWEKMCALASPALLAKIDAGMYRYKSGAGRVNNGGTYTVRALTGWLMIEMTFAGVY
jgi:hypothetical protein